MPELPEVESLRRILARSAVGRTIERARIAEPRLRRKVAHDFAAGVEGRRIERLGRRAKYLIIELSGGSAMIVHLGMSGSLTHRGKDFDDAEFAARHDHVEFALDDRTRLVYNDPRRFGLIRLVAQGELAAAPELAGLGPEPLSAPSMRSTWRGWLAGGGPRSRTSSWINGWSPESATSMPPKFCSARESGRRAAPPR